jgi:ABC-type transport system involved in multi-copper enzyme maturation permease subunit
VAENPVIAKELRGRMRGRQAFILISLYLLLLSGILALIYLIATIDSGAAYRRTPEFRQGLGKALFGTVILMELLMIPFIAPGLTSGAIAAEREHRTLDLLRTTLLSARSLVLGKLGAAFAFLLLLIFAALPLESIAFMLGGVGLEELLVSTLLLIVTAIYFCALGLFFSSVMKRVLTATVSSYASIVLGILSLVVVYVLVLFVESASYSYTGTTSPNPFWTNLLSVITWVLLSVNPLMAAIMSEVLLVDQQQIFFTTDPFASNSGLILPSPWIIYTLVMLFLTFIMIWWSIRAVKRPDR